MARTTACLALFMRALDPAALSRLDGRTPPVKNEDPAAIDVAKLRVGFYEDDGVLSASHACGRAVREAVAALRERGCTAIAFEPPRAADVVYDFLAGVSADGGALVARALAGGSVDPVMKPLLALASLPAAGRRALARVASVAGEKRLARMLDVLGRKQVEDFWRVVSSLRAHRARFVAEMDRAGLDVLVCPPYATPALPHGMAKNFTLGASYAMLFNALQLPAGVVPVTRVRAGEAKRERASDTIEKHAAKVDAKSAGLPVGVQVVARPWAEATVLAVMQAVEEAARQSSEFPRTPA
jgi:fatty acid amide hydrolase